MISEAFKSFAPESRLWIYQADRKLSDNDVESIRPLINAFCRQWTAHNKQLNAAGDILLNRFLILVVDENAHEASGCSIDKSVHFLKELQAEFHLDWFNRLQQAYFTSADSVETFAMSELNALLDSGTIKAQTRVFNNSIVQLSQLESDWICPLDKSWLKKKYELWNKSTATSDL